MFNEACSRNLKTSARSVGRGKKYLCIRKCRARFSRMPPWLEGILELVLRRQSERIRAACCHRLPCCSFVLEARRMRRAAAAKTSSSSTNHKFAKGEMCQRMDPGMEPRSRESGCTGIEISFYSPSPCWIIFMLSSCWVRSSVEEWQHKVMRRIL